MIYSNNKIRLQYTVPTKIIFIAREKKAMYFNQDLEEVEYFNTKRAELSRNFLPPIPTAGILHMTNQVCTGIFEYTGIHIILRITECPLGVKLIPSFLGQLLLRRSSASAKC